MNDKIGILGDAEFSLRNSAGKKKALHMAWEKRAKRFILFFDILGFKDLVIRQSHLDILEKLESINQLFKTYSGETLENSLSEFNVKKDQIHSVIFSDSIIVFSKSDLASDALIILGIAHAIMKDTLKNGIAIKGAISYGEITVDIDKSIFFGQPLIDAYLLHEDLFMISVILDHNAENKIDLFQDGEVVAKKNLIKTEAYMKYGKTSHTLLRPSEKFLPTCKDELLALYKGVSGRPRQYLDNTLKFYDLLTNSK